MMQNDVATCQQVDAELTRECSPDVPCFLIQIRKAHGYDSPIGRRCSNILEMLDAKARPSDILTQASELAALLHPKGA